MKLKGKLKLENITITIFSHVMYKQLLIRMNLLDTMNYKYYFVLGIVRISKWLKISSSNCH